MMANLLTFSRLVAALVMLLCAPASVPFWILYGWCGVSDMADGAVARRFGQASDFGARLDSVCDLVFVAVCLVVLLPFVPLPPWLVVWIAAIVLCKVAGYALGFFKRGRLVMLHTVANKATGLLLFFTVPAVVVLDSALLAIPACALATFASVQEVWLVGATRRDGGHEEETRR